MARFNFEESENYGAVKNNYFNLKDDGDTAVVRFLYNDINDVEGVAVHEVKIGDRTIDVECIRAYNEPVDKCPLCNAGHPVSAKMYIPVYDQTSKESKIWKRGKTFFGRIAKLCERYRPLVGVPIEVVRNGKAGEKTTTYELLPQGENKDTKQIVDFPEIKAENVSFQIKSKEDMEYYLQNGAFPQDNQVKTRQNTQTSREMPVRRRTPNYGSEEDSF